MGVEPKIGVVLSPKSSILIRCSIINHPFWGTIRHISRWWQLKHFWNFHPGSLGEMIQFDDHIFQMGWFNHQLDTYIYSFALEVLASEKQYLRLFREYVFQIVRSSRNFNNHRYFVKRSMTLVVTSVSPNIWGS